MKGLAPFLALCLSVLPAAVAFADPASAAKQASDQLSAAAEALDEAKSARDRVRALTETVRAYEAGLAAMRDGLRRAATREAQLSRELEIRRGDIAQLLGVLQSIGSAPPPVLMLHPAGPLGSARSGMLVADVTPALTRSAEALRADLDEVQTLRGLQQNAAQTLEDGLQGVQQARADLSQAIAERIDLPTRFTADPVRTAILMSSTETLEAFANGLANLTDGDLVYSDADISGMKGRLPLPVGGVVLHRAGEADAAGVTRPGLLLATGPRALVTAPAAATIRYLGPLLDLGNVVMLEPQPDMLLVFSGLGEVFGQPGQVIPGGTPVGLMGGENPEVSSILSLSGDGSGTERSETLYIEVRESGNAVDPETWFRIDKDG